MENTNQELEVTSVITQGVTEEGMPVWTSRKLKINAFQIYDVIIAHLYATGQITHDEDVVTMTIPMEMSEDNLVEVELTTEVIE
jgi:hypothetical protein